jgi:hypothetical protein
MKPTVVAMKGYRVLQSTNRGQTGFWNRFLTSDTPHAEILGDLESRAMMSAAVPVLMAEALATPTGVTATPTEPRVVQIQWASTIAGATGFKVMRAGATGAFTEVGRVNGSTLTFKDATVAPNTAYRYQVIAGSPSAASPPSAIASVRTPMAAPINLAAAIVSGAFVQLTWQGQDPTATGFVVSRSTAGGAWTVISRIATPSATGLLDVSTVRGQTYAYRIQAITATASSVQSAPVTAAIPVAAPSTMSVTVTSTAHTVRWSIGDPMIREYTIERATETGAFTPLATVAPTVGTYTDSAVTGGTAYTYRITVNGINVPSTRSAAIRVVAMLRTPDAPTVSRSGSAAVISWNAANGATVGYRIQRSLDGSNFSSIRDVAAGAARTFTDSSEDAARQVWYRVQAIMGANATGFSGATRIAAVTPPAPAPTPTPAPTPAPTPTPLPSNVSITTRYGNEMVVTLNGGTSNIRVTGSGATLTITSGGQTISQVSMPGALFIYDRGGTNAIAIDASVGVRTTVTSVGGGTTSITSAHANVTAWIDTTDTFSGSGVVHSIGTLAGNVSKAAGASLPNPTDSGLTRDANASLWGSGPSAADINQGAVGDCYFLASLAGFAVSSPTMIRERAVDLGDGTYIVKFTQANNAVYVRVSDDLPTTNGTNYRYARPGATGSVWAPVMEKAFAYFRTGANTYASTNAGWMGDVYTAFGVASSTIWLSGTNESAFYTMISGALASGKAITFGTFSSPPKLVGGHAYTLTSVRMGSNGAAIYTVRNPWGVSGRPAENSSGYAELTFAEMVANFQAGVRAA